MESIINLSYIVNAVVFSVLGIVILALGFVCLDKLTPYQLWHEIVKEKNVALAIVVGAATLAIGMIIASAVH